VGEKPWGSTVVGNEEADRKAKMEVWMGERMCRPDIVTPAASDRPSPYIRNRQHISSGQGPRYGASRT